MKKNNGKKIVRSAKGRAAAKRALGRRFVGAAQSQYHVLTAGKNPPKDAKVIILVRDASPDHEVAFGPFDGVEQATGYLDTVKRASQLHYQEDPAALMVRVGWTRAEEIRAPMSVETLDGLKSGEIRAPMSVDTLEALKNGDMPFAALDPGSDESMDRLADLLGLGGEAEDERGGIIGEDEDCDDEVGGRA